ncbi:MAG: hypothetical protein MI757_02230 [Pirellulales bacterium]|nr:hypothetical protein [Pirellulales bacterium]
MDKDSLVEILAERPFTPIRLHMSNGRTHVISHPELAIVGDFTVAIGYEREDGRRMIKMCAIEHINEAEPDLQDA